MTQQKTIAQVLDFIPNQMRTMESFLIRYASALHKENWHVVFVVAGNPSEHFLKLISSNSLASVLVADFPLTKGNGRLIGRLLTPYKPSIIQTHFVSLFDSGLLPMKKESKCPMLIVTDHSSGVGSAKPLALRAAAWARGRLASRHVDHVIAVSEFVANRVKSQSYYPGNRVSTVYNGVDTERFRPASSTNADGGIVFAGQVEAKKGLVTLLSAIKLLHDSGYSVRLDIAGEGSLSIDLEKLANGLGIREFVHYLGRQDHIEACFRRAQIVVVPSEWEEAFGLVAAEACACGACVVVSDAGGSPEVVGNEGTAGVVFSRGNAQDLASKLRILLGDADRRKTVGRQARMRAVENFSLDSMVRGHVSHIQKLSEQLN